MRIGIYAAAGNIGSRVVGQLAKGNHVPVAFLRTLSKQAGLPTGVEVRKVDVPNAEQLAEAIRDIDALFWVTPVNMAVSDVAQWYRDSTLALEQALAVHPVRRVVHISSLGAGTKPGLGTISYVGEVEQRLNRVAPNVVHLRPGYFMQNLFMNVAELAGGSTLSLPYAPDHDIPWISVTDIAQAAVRYLTDDQWTGQWYCNLMGPCNLTGPDLAAAISSALGRAVSYRQVSLDDHRAMFARFGLPARVVDELIELTIGLGDPDGIYATPRTHEAGTPTTFERFVQEELKPAIEASFERP